MSLSQLSCQTVSIDVQFYPSCSSSLEFWKFQFLLTLPPVSAPPSAAVSIFVLPSFFYTDERVLSALEFIQVVTVEVRPLATRYCWRNTLAFTHRVSLQKGASSPLHVCATEA